MKYLFYFVILMHLTYPLHAFQKALYGEDNREYSTRSQLVDFVELSKSTAAMISTARLSFFNEKAKIQGPSYKEYMEVCSDERFADDIIAAGCSGFLIGEDLLVTAGHCVDSQIQCQYNYWVFDFHIDQPTDNLTMTIPSDSVYRCKEIISFDYSQKTMNDYALIRLDRKVRDREPLAFRSKGKIKEHTPLVLIGHPSGLATMIADDAQVLEGENQNPYFFRTNLDAYGHNSGSAVFNQETGEVEGILVRGEQDFRYDKEAGCYRSNQCTDTTCVGEDVTRITVIPELFESHK